MPTPNLPTRRILAALALLPAVLFAQAADETIVLSPFEVSASDDGYRANNAISATRVNVSIAEIPMSIAVLTSEFLADTAATDLNSAVDYVGGLSKTNQSTFAGDSAFALRGFGLTPVFRNGVRSWLNITDSAAVDRVEVVKGPASVLYGNAAPGGLINYITKRPLPIARYETKFTYGSWDYKRAELDATGPLAGNSRGALYRIVAAYTDRDSFRRFETLESFFVAPTLTFPLGERTKVRTELEYETVDAVLPRILSGEFAFITGRNTVYTDLPKNFNLGGNDSQNDRYRLTGQVVLDHEFSPETFLRAVVSGDETEAKGWNINTHFPVRRLTPEPVVFVTPRFREDDADNLFIRLDLSTAVALGGIRHNLVFGTEYRTTDEETIEYTWAGANKEIPIRRFNELPDSAFDLANDFSNPDLRRTLFADSGTDVVSGYLIDQMSALDDRLKVLAGLRYDSIELTGRNLNTGAATERTKPDQWSPQVSALYQLGGGLGAFASYSTSLEPVRGFTTAGNAFTPQEGIGYEAGIKLSAFDNRLSGSISYFEITRNNVVNTDFDLATGTFVITQAGEQRSEGIDVQLIFSPTDSWQTLVNYVVMDPIISRGAIAADGSQPTRGEQLRNTPKNKFDLWTRYSFRTGALKGLAIGGGYIHMATVPGVSAGGATVWWPGWSRFDLMASYEFKLGDLDATFRLNCENVGDERYVFGEGYLGTPTSVRTSLTLKF